ncbi:MAG: hypothetical protein HY864_08115 [Chloroflexi bacterium]|nr:hypothetical protein [Chloroflexota bacterium]
MNRTIRFVIAGMLALLIIAGAASAWASPNRQGTVPVPPSFALIGGENTSCATVNMVNVVFTIFPPDDKNYVCAATNITVPSPEEYGPAPKDTVFYGDVFKFIVTLDDAEVVDISTQVCYAYPPEFEEKEAKVYRWEADSKAWAMVEDGGEVSGDPKQICATSPKTGIFSLIGKP